MKKALKQTLIFLVVMQLVVVLSSIHVHVPDGYSLSEGTISYKYIGDDEEYIRLNIEDRFLYSHKGYLNTYLLLDIGDQVTVLYKLNSSKTSILDAEIVDWWRTPFTIDKLVFELFGSAFLFGLLARKERQGHHFQ